MSVLLACLVLRTAASNPLASLLGAKPPKRSANATTTHVAKDLQSLKTFVTDAINPRETAAYSAEVRARAAVASRPTRGVATEPVPPSLWAPTDP